MPNWTRAFKANTARREFASRLKRGRQWLWLKRNVASDAERTSVFVVGCQRSGTNMLMWTLEQSPYVWVHHEHTWNAAFKDFRLRSTRVIADLIERNPGRTIAFKPVCDAHLTDRLLERHAGSRAVWIYRRYQDVANSAVRLFGEHQKDVMRWIAQGDYDLLQWRGERLPVEIVELAREIYRDDLSGVDAAAFMWLTRNRFFFDLKLDEDDRVLLVCYEDLVSGNPDPFRELFEFVGCPFEDRFLETIFSSSVGKRKFPPIHPRISEECRKLTEQLDAARTRGSSGEVDSDAGSLRGAGGAA